MYTESMTMNEIVSKQISQQGAVPFPLIAIRQAIKAMAVVSSDLTAKWVNHLWFKTGAKAIKKEHYQWIKQAEVSYLTIDEETVPVYRWGTGPTILFVHGWSGFGAQVTPMAKYLVSKGYEVIAFDGPGHGDASGKSANLVQFEKIIQQLDQQIGVPFDLIAHSIGSIASVSAIVKGAKVKSLTLVGAPINMDYCADYFSAQLALPKKVAAKNRGLIEQKFGHNIWHRFGIDKAGANLDLPTLLVHDKKDKQVDVVNTQKILQKWPHAESLLTEGLGHNRTLSDAGAIKVIEQFIEKNSQRS